MQSYWTMVSLDTLVSAGGRSTRTASGFRAWQGFNESTISTEVGQTLAGGEPISAILQKVLTTPSANRFVFMLPAVRYRPAEGAASGGGKGVECNASHQS
jgi:hypothetical protein